MTRIRSLSATSWWYSQTAPQLAKWTIAILAVVSHRSICNSRRWEWQREVGEWAAHFFLVFLCGHDEQIFNITCHVQYQTRFSKGYFTLLGGWECMITWFRMSQRYTSLVGHWLSFTNTLRFFRNRGILKKLLTATTSQKLLNSKIWGAWLRFLYVSVLEITKASG